MVTIQQKSEKINMQVKDLNDTDITSIENEIVYILNKYKITSDQFDIIINNIINRKANAYLIFSYYDKNQPTVDTSTMDEISTSVDNSEARQIKTNVWF